MGECVRTVFDFLHFNIRAAYTLGTMESVRLCYTDSGITLRVKHNSTLDAIKLTGTPFSHRVHASKQVHTVGPGFVIISS